jgi:hypothetical protein
MIYIVALHCEKAFYHDTHGWLSLLFLERRGIPELVGEHCELLLILRHLLPSICSLEDVYRVMVQWLREVESWSANRARSSSINDIQYLICLVLSRSIRSKKRDQCAPYDPSIWYVSLEWTCIDYSGINYNFASSFTVPTLSFGAYFFNTLSL